MGAGRADAGGEGGAAGAGVLKGAPLCTLDLEDRHLAALAQEGSESIGILIEDVEKKIAFDGN